MKNAVAMLFLFCLGGFARDTASRKLDVLWAKLAQQIELEDARLDGVMGVAIVDLTDHREWTLRANEVFPTASTIKLAALAELFHQEELSRQGAAGNARLADVYTVSAKDLVPDSAVLGNMTPGVTILTNRDLAGAVVAVSDNSASNILTIRLGMSRINGLLDSLNLKETRMQRQMMDLDAAREGRENIASPADLVALLEAIYRKKLFRRELPRDFFALLSTPKDSWLPRRLPEEVKIANKPGALAGVRCDAGIVFVPNRPFAIAIMTSYDRDEHAAEEMISRVALETWRMFDVISVSSEYGRQITERNSH